MLLLIRSIISSAEVRPHHPFLYSRWFTSSIQSGQFLLFFFQGLCLLPWCCGRLWCCEKHLCCGRRLCYSLLTSNLSVVSVSNFQVLIFVGVFTVLILCCGRGWFQLLQAHSLRLFLWQRIPHICWYFCYFDSLLHSCSPVSDFSLNHDDGSTGEPIGFLPDRSELLSRVSE